MAIMELKECGKAVTINELWPSFLNASKLVY
jgi:hypothetical protein